MGHDLRIGAINWDNSLPEDTYFGYYSSLVLSPEKYRSVTPYYARINAGRVTFAPKTQESFDEELALAVEAGIDYMAYDWYTEERLPAPEDPHNVDHTVRELNHARRLHETSSLNTKIRLCAVIICPHPMSERDYGKLAEDMKQDFYEKIDGRPLVYLFSGYYVDIIEKLREFPEKYGTADPFIVFLGAGEGGKIDKSIDYTKADGVSAYASCTGNVKTFRELTEHSIAANELRKGYGIPVLPHFSAGWNPTPRVDNPIPWTTYAGGPYAEPAAEDELFEGAVRLADWIRENRDRIVPGHILAFAWNEFEEGGFICPTYGEDGKRDESHLRGFRKAAEYWRETL